VRDQSGIEGLLRELAPQVLGILLRRYQQFDACEDALQEALLAASVHWSDNGVPDSPRSWLVTVASRRFIDELRSENARRRREETAFVTDLPEQTQVSDRDDTLVLLFMCCHPALTSASQLALTLRAIGGLTTGEIARALLVPEATLAQRISRAKQRIRNAGATFTLPPLSERRERLTVVLQVLYLIFNEGYAASTGPSPHRADLTTEAIRLTRMLSDLLPSDGETTGLLALMLLTEARSDARVGEDGMLIALAEQARDRWNADQIDEGILLVTRALATGPVGPYQVQAAIAAVHDEAKTADETDWPQILALYTVLEQVAPNPVVTLNRAVAVAMVDGPRAGLVLLGTLDNDDRLASTHRLESVRGHLLERVGDTTGARAAYRRAARLCANLAEQRYLVQQVTRLE
jgi:RNA polymerase sigma factor (sigma-70 family)